jgi:hypothetical protein
LKYPTAHSHIVSVGTGDASKANTRWEVSEVRTALRNGDVFYTSDGSGNIALVSAYDCACGYKTIRSAADATAKNNLDQLRACSWR